MTQELINAVKEISSQKVGIDWSQFVPAIIATFLGFGLALFGQWLWEKIKDNKDSKKIKLRIENELEQILAALNTISGIDVEPLNNPTWKACIYSGEIKILDGDLQKNLFQIYNTIAEYNAWSLMLANYYFENGKPNAELLNELVRLKNILLHSSEDRNSIQDAISSLKGGF